MSERQPMEGVRISTEKVTQIVKLLCEGLGIRATARLTGTNQRTVMNVMVKAGHQCAEFMDDRFYNLKNEPLEIDECWTFVSNKRRKGNSDTCGDFYTFLASGKQSKLIMSFVTGKRQDDVGEDFIRDIRSRMPDQFQITSDGWTGFVRGVINVAFERANYAMQNKKYADYNAPKRPKIKSIEECKQRYHQKGKCISVETKVICGTPNPADITTSHAERFNLSLRHFNKRFTRLSPCFSKKLENLCASVALTIGYFNYCRTHAAVKVKATETEKAVERTPAMAAGLTDHVWTVSELLVA